MNTLLIGNGYWGQIIKQKLILLTNLVYVASSKDDLDILLKKYKVDFVFVCTPTHTHYQIVKKCIEYGLNVFCEKPFTGSEEIAQELYNLADEKKVKIFVDNTFFFRNETLQIKSKVFNNIKFVWKKYEEHYKENIYFTLLYHDLYLLITTSDENWTLKYLKLTNDKLFLILGNNSRRANFYYDRNYKKQKEKKIYLDNLPIDYSFPDNDALYDIIEQISNGNCDYKKNKQLTQKTLKLLKKIIK